MDAKLLDILVCPDCKGPLEHDREQSELRCRRCRLIYPINEHGVPVMIIDDAKRMKPEED